MDNFEEYDQYDNNSLVSLQNPIVNTVHTRSQSYPHSSQLSQHSTSDEIVMLHNGVEAHHSLTLLPSKTINDPIHGFIQVEWLLMKIIDTPHFQRLRNLAQLGAGSFVFPGATHNRFQHSIGTMHLAGKMAEKLREKDFNGELNLTDRIILLIKAAGLCHDLGHGPLSHCFDGLFIPHIVETTDDEELRSRLKEWAHEDASEMMLEAAIKSAGLMDPLQYTDPLTEDDVTFIKQLINPQEGEAKIYPSYAYAYDIVSNSRNSIDVDKLDYLERDCANAGLRSAFRCEHILNNAKVINQTVCFHKRVAWDIYELFHTRYSLHKQVYSHRKVKCVEYMITDAMKLADPVLLIAERIFSAEKYVTLHDSIIHQIEFYPLETILNENHRKDMAKAQHILQSLRNRNIYRFCAESLLPETDDIGKMKAQVKFSLTREKIYGRLKQMYPKTTLLKEDLEIQILQLNYANQDKNPLDRVFFYNSVDDNESHKIPHQKISLLIPKRFEELYARIFIRKNDKTEIICAARAFDACLTATFKGGGLSQLDNLELQAREGLQQKLPFTTIIGDDDDHDDDCNDFGAFGGMNRYFSQAVPNTFMSDSVSPLTSNNSSFQANTRPKGTLSVIHSSIPQIQRSVTLRKMQENSQIPAQSQSAATAVPHPNIVYIGREETLSTPTKRNLRMIPNQASNAANHLALTTPNRANNTSKSIPATPQLHQSQYSSQTEIEDQDDNIFAIEDQDDNIFAIDSDLPPGNAATKRKAREQIPNIDLSQSKSSTSSQPNKRQNTSKTESKNQNVIDMMKRSSKE